MAKMKKAQMGAMAAPAKKVVSKSTNDRMAKYVAPKSVMDLSKTPTQRALSKDKVMQKDGGVTKKAKAGKQMIKRADGSYSQRGLWDNIRAAKGSGKKPTSAMLKQERKIKAKTKK
jgi:hypothetical protein